MSKRQKRRQARGIQEGQMKPKLARRIAKYQAQNTGGTSRGNHELRARGSQKCSRN